MQRILFPMALSLSIITGSLQASFTEWARAKSAHFCRKMITSPHTSDLNKKNWEAILNTIEPVNKSNNDQTPKKLRAGERPSDLQDIVDKFKANLTPSDSLNLKPPHAILLYGPSGTGKTTLARDLAPEIGAAFINVSATELMSMWVGQSAANVRDLYQRARRALFNGSPYVIIFIDEIDAIGGARNSIISTGEYQNALNELLVQIDGFVQEPRIITIAATNLPELLDPALKRRFDLMIEVPLPDTALRKEVLFFYAEQYPHDKTINFDDLADRTAGFNNADLRLVIERAVVYAKRAGSNRIMHDHCLQAINEIEHKRSV